MNDKKFQEEVMKNTKSINRQPSILAHVQRKKITHNEQFLLMKKIWKTQAMVGLRVMKKTTYQIQRDSLMQRWWKGDVLAGKKGSHLLGRGC